MIACPGKDLRQTGTGGRRTMMAKRPGGVIIIEPSVSLVRRFELAPNEVSMTIRVSFVGDKNQNS